MVPKIMTYFSLINKNLYYIKGCDVIETKVRLRKNLKKIPTLFFYKARLNMETRFEEILLTQQKYFLKK